uniref:Insulin-like domain-containing protein n=1 Tax=Sinocyclocheilus grahami TaxID=75366 RepID=A0A672NID8_SINGR
SNGHPVYGVKLCGREFIRAVIFTCGGSRWRRKMNLWSKCTIYVSITF